MNAIVLVAVPLLGFAVFSGTSRRPLAIALPPGAALVELLLALVSESDGEVGGVVYVVDGFARLLIALLSAAVLLAMASALGEGRKKAVPLLLLVLSPGTAALIVRPSPQVAVLMLELAFFAVVLLMRLEPAARALDVQRYLTVVVVGGILAQLALAVGGLYPVSHDQYLPRLVLSIGAVGWGLLVAAFPFQFWLPPAIRSVSTPTAVAVLGVARPLALAVFIGTLVEMPWLFSDQRTWGSLATAGSAAACACALISLGQRKLLSRICYLAAADLGYVLAGLGAGSALGIVGAIVATISHLLAMVLLPSSLALLASGKGTPWWGEQRAGTVGLAVGMLALLGAPPGSGFVARWIIYQAVWPDNPSAVVALLAANAIIMVSSIALVVTAASGKAAVGRINGRTGIPAIHIAGVAVATALVLVIGIYPAPLLATLATALGAQSGLPSW